MRAESPLLAGKRKHVMRRKREQTQSLNFLSVFFWFSYMLVLWFHLHRFASGVRPLFGGPNFRLSLYFRGWCTTCVSTSSLPTANPLSIPNRPLLLPGSRGRSISLSAGSTPAQKIWDLQFFVFFNCRGRYGWFFFLFFSSLSPSHEIRLLYSL